MRRNNCWLAVLAVTTILPILRHGLARERFPVDRENTVLRANNSKIAYRTERPLSNLDDETDPEFPSDSEQSPDSATRECAVPSDATRGCARTEDLFEEGYAIGTSLEASRNEEIERVNGPSTKRSKKRFDDSRAVENRATRTVADDSISERSTRSIPRGAIKDSSERTVDAIRRTERATTRARNTRGTRSTNRRGIVDEPESTYYDHVARIPTTSARGDAGRSISTEDRGPDNVRSELLGEVDGDVGSRTRSRSESRERSIVPERSSSVDEVRAIVNAVHGTVESGRERRISVTRTPVERTVNDGTNPFSSRGTRNDRDESVYDLIHGRGPTRDSIDTGAKNLDRSERSLDERETKRRRSLVLENTERLSEFRKSTPVSMTNEARVSRVGSSPMREIRVAFSAPATTAGARSVSDTVERLPTGRERWNLVSFRDALVSVTPSKGYYPRKNADRGRATRNGTEFNFPGNNGVASDSSNVREPSSSLGNDRIERRPREDDIERDGPPIEKFTTSRNLTNALENTPADSARDGTPATERNLVYPKRDPNPPSEDRFDPVSNDPRPRVRNARDPRGDTEKPFTETTPIVGNSSTNESSGESTANRERGTLVATAYDAYIAPPRKDQERSARVDGPLLSASYDRSISLAELSRSPPLKRNDRSTENYDEKGTAAGLEELNGPPTNDPVIVFEDKVSRTTGRDSLSQNSRLSARVIEDNETPVGFPSGEPSSKADRDAVATNEINPTTELGDKNTGGRSNESPEPKDSIKEPLEPKDSINEPRKIPSTNR
ncbi:uncharacterized protein LOC143153410 [Ptiloglossa arizonensis]|uniref:uncharacterized protein LOC143153410 n=1 Tax=Ptiloglossa arizonensis TaxID=3350558 RepID=UPI003FA079C9